MQTASSGLESVGLAVSRVASSGLESVGSAVSLVAQFGVSRLELSERHSITTPRQVTGRARLVTRRLSIVALEQVIPDVALRVAPAYRTHTFTPPRFGC